MVRSRFAPASDPQDRIACPLCGRTCDHVIATKEDVEIEIGLRRRFFLSRLEGTIDSWDLRDLTEMTTSDPAPVYGCGVCEVLVREDGARTPARFALDEYNRRMLQELHDLHVGTVLAKTSIRDLLPHGSRVLEIGSYVGGFLEAARQWGWKATGIDIGRDTAGFTAERGYDVTTERFERREFDESFDGVFIWNCFEQMTNPQEVLARVRSIARERAPLVIFVPDGAVYREAERAFSEGEPRDGRARSCSSSHTTISSVFPTISVTTRSRSRGSWPRADSPCIQPRTFRPSVHFATG